MSGAHSTADGATLKVPRQITPVLPWADNAEDVLRFKRILKIVLGVFLFFGLLLALLPEPEIDREEAEKVPSRIAKVIQRKKPPPPPPEKKPEEKKPEEKKPEEKKPKEKPKEKKKLTPEQLKQARERAKKSGLLALKDQLAALRKSSTVQALKKQTNLSKDGAKASAQRKLLTSRATSGSGGIQTAAISHGVEGELAQRTVTQVESAAAVAALEEEQSRKGGARERSTQEIAATIDRFKSAFYQMYQRALRKDPTLQGRVVFELVVQPDGKVTSVRIVSSELNNARLERRLVARMKMVAFEPKEVEVWKGTFNFDFLPM